jgi:lipoprotein-anchoring transpeptidase ErfK/SrfK
VVSAAPLQPSREFVQMHRIGLKNFLDISCIRGAICHLGKHIGSGRQQGIDSMMKSVLVAVTFAAMLFASSVASFAASLVARVDVASQTMTVSRYGQVIHVWRVSTARKGYFTPRGIYRPTRLHRMWYSKKYDMAPMPYSVFYHGGYAIHGTGHVKQLGRPASHGCVRLDTANAARFYSLVKEVGPSDTRIIVVN